jgi:hypothetical protein
MANTYTVTPADVAAELAGLFPGGFTTTSVPTDAQVADMINAADTYVTLRITDSVGTAPNVADKAASLAKRYIIESAKAQVIRVVYLGRDPFAVSQAASPYEAVAKLQLESIDLLGSQAIGTGEASPRVVTSMGASSFPSRDLLVDTIDLDAGSGLRGRY